MNLITQYQETRDPEIGKQLIADHGFLINQHIQKWSGTIPDIVIKKHAHQYALDAFRTYDPTKSQIQTHLYNHLSRLSRLNYAHQNVVQIPEHQIRQISAFNNSINFLRDNLDREPSHQEIADHMGLPINHVLKLSTNLRKEIGSDPEGYSSSQLLGVSGVSDEMKTKLFDVLNHMPEQDKVKFDDLTGFNGIKPLTPKQFGRKYKLKPYEVSRFKSSLAKKLEGISE